MTNSNHLHAESKTHPFKEHCQMLSKQFLLATQQDSHPNNINHINYNPARLMKNILTLQHDNYIRPLIRPGNPQHYKFLLKPIHTKSVSAYIQSQDNNPVLDEPPPPRQIRIKPTQKN